MALRLGRDPLDYLVERGCFPVLDVHRYLDEPRARQVQAERADAREASTLLAHDRRDRTRRREIAAQVYVESDQRPARAEDHAAGARVQLRRAEVGRELAVLDPLLQSLRPAAAVVGRTALRRRVEEHRQAELVCDARADRGRRTHGTLPVVWAERDDRHDVGRADPRMRAVVLAEVDPLFGDGDACDERVGQLVLGPDEREDGAVVILVGVDVEQARVRVERSADRVDRRAVAPDTEVRNRLERQHGRTLRAVKEYYDTRAPEYDDWWLGRGLYSGRERRGWEDELGELAALIASLPPTRTLDVACGTGFLTQHLRGDVVGLDQSARMLEIAAHRLPHATFVQGD